MSRARPKGDPLRVVQRVLTFVVPAALAVWFLTLLVLYVPDALSATCHLL